MNKLLDIFSIIGSFLIIFGILFLIQNVAFGQIPAFKNIVVFKFIHLKDLIFIATSLLIINKYIRFHVPKRE